MSTNARLTECWSDDRPYLLIIQGEKKKNQCVFRNEARVKEISSPKDASPRLLLVLARVMYRYGTCKMELSIGV